MGMLVTMATTATLPSAPRAARKRVLMTAALFTPEGTQKVRLRNTSASGAQVVLETPIQPGQDAILKRGSIFAAARVAWANNLEAGLEFYREEVNLEIRQLDQRA